MVGAKRSFFCGHPVYFVQFGHFGHDDSFEMFEILPHVITSIDNFDLVLLQNYSVSLQNFHF